MFPSSFVAPSTKYPIYLIAFLCAFLLAPITAWAELQRQGSDQPSSGSWTQVSAGMPTQATVVQLLDGRVLVEGAVTLSNPASSSEPSQLDIRGTSFLPNSFVQL